MAACAECGTRFAPASRGRRRRYCSRSCQARAYRARARARGRQQAVAAGADRAPSSPGLSTARIAAAAVRIADVYGLETLAMRHVAAELGVATMSLYHYVRGKDELVELMVETVFREAAGPPPGALPGTHSRTRHGGDGGSESAGGDWRPALQEWARREWALLRRHPWVLRVVTDFPPVTSPGLLADVERVIASLVDAGLDPVTAHQAFQSASGLAEGLALLQASTSEAARRGLTARWRTQEIPAVLERLGAEKFPTQTALVESLDAALDVERMFEFGLARLLDGVEQFLAEEQIDTRAAAG